ncbi:ABC transporter substrate-binding protein [Cohnella sp. LGH]|uniref:ABC transporter substrate-binding protein n=1 Tax=Cohnella sp. LGH TaxID=1619153 RepID=UPI001ADB4FCF|nr:ABC transporter substrate-binding protein [Cohnella sp. LGH]QTH41529.1 ABC transporter substrate-binding protein [Cohnella sp. LGH]
MKKSMGFLSVALLSMSMILGACGSNNNSDSSPSTPSGSAGASSAEAPKSSESELKPYEIRVVYPAGAVPKDLAIVQDEMNKYLTEKINATVKLEPIDWGSWMDKTNLMISSGEKFDIVVSSNTLGYSVNVAKGAYAPLNDLVEKYGANIKASVDAGFLEGTKVNGEMYGIPVNKEFASSYGYLLNKSLVEKYNIDVSTIKQAADLEPYLELIKANEPDIIPFFVGMQRSLGNFASIGDIDQLGGSVGALDRNSNELKVINQFEMPYYNEMATLAHKWYKAGYINKDAVTVTDFGQMQVGKAFAMQMELKPGKDAEMSQAWGLDVVQVQVKEPYTTTGNITGIMGSISRTTEDPERAMMFLDLLYGDKYLLNLFDFGVEGVHFVKKSDSVIDYAEGVSAESIGYRNEPWMWGNQMITYLFANEDPNKWENFKNFNAQAQKSIALGFAFDVEPVKNEVAAVANVLKQYQDVIDAGLVDPAQEIAKFNEALKAAGVDKIVAEKQRQLDEWASNQ